MGRVADIDAGRPDASHNGRSDPVARAMARDASRLTLFPAAGLIHLRAIMETPSMKQVAVVLAAILLAGSAGAGDVYVTKDAKGNTVYTDTPQTLPAEKVTVQGQGSSQPAAAQQDSSDMQQYKAQDQAYENSQAQQAEAKKAAEDSAADRAKRCADARQQYQNMMNSHRLYEEGPNGERTYLTSEQIDKTRANAKEVMDQFCSGQ